MIGPEEHGQATESGRRRQRGRFGARRDDTPAQLVSTDAEAHVLGCVLNHGSSALNDARRAGVGEASFYVPANGVIWTALCALVERRVEPAIETLMADLAESGKLDSIGGLAYLMSLGTGVVTTVHLRFFSERLIELEGLRRVDAAARRLIEGVRGYSGGGLESFQELAAARVTLEEVQRRGSRQLPPILGWRDFVGEKPRDKPDELVEGVLHRGAKMMLSGGSKSFKTWGLLDLGLSVATGTPWWGHATKAGPVLYLNMELMLEFCEDRVRKISEAKKISEARDFHSWHLRGYARDFRELMPHIINRVAGVQYVLVILDPVYKVLGEVDENNNGEVAQLLNEFEALTVKMGAAVAYGHHHSKGNQADKDARDRSSGAGAWTRDPDALIDLTPHSEDEHFTATYTLRNMAPVKPKVLRWEFPCMSFAPGKDPAALRGSGRPVENSVADILGPLKAAPKGISYSVWEDACVGRGVSESTFKRLQKKAIADGTVVKAFGVYQLSDVAREKMGI